MDGVATAGTAFNEAVVFLSYFKALMALVVGIGYRGLL